MTNNETDQDEIVAENIDEETSGIIQNENQSEISSDVTNAKWYIVQTQSNYELRVQKRISTLIEEEKFGPDLIRVLVPTQETVELKNNKRVEKTTKIFPGYVFIQMNFRDDIAYEIRQLPGVLKFIGISGKPTPVVEDEILRVLRKVGDSTKEIDVDFEVGEVIKVIDGPFRGYTGTISDLNPSKGNLKAKISIFGRETPVELDFDKVEKTI